MTEKKKGGILNVASLAGFKPYPFIALYSATKSFILNFTLAISKEFEEKGVKVMALCPGSTATEFFKESTKDSGGSFFKLSGVMSPEEVAKEAIIAFKKGKRICIPGMQNKFMKKITDQMPVGLFLKMIHGFLKNS